MNKNQSFLLILLISFAACSPKITTSLVNPHPKPANNSEVIVFEEHMPLPDSLDYLGVVSITDNGLSVKCGYDEVIALAKTEVQKAGGNVLKINEHIWPDFVSSCHRIHGSIHSTSDLQALADKTANKTNPTIAQQLAQMANSEDIQTTRNEERNYGKVRFGLNAGYSRRTAKLAKIDNYLLADHLKKLKNGFTLGGEFDYFITETSGLGLRYNYFKASNTINNVYYTDPFGVTKTGMLNSDIHINYFGPNYTYRQYNQTQTGAIIMSLSLGYMHYLENSQIGDELLTMKGSTLGSMVDFGYDFKVGKTTWLGARFSLIAGTLSSVTLIENGETQIKTLDEDQREGLGRFELTVGLRFGK